MVCLPLGDFIFFSPNPKKVLWTKQNKPTKQSKKQQQQQQNALSFSNNTHIIFDQTYIMQIKNPKMKTHLLQIDNAL